MINEIEIFFEPDEESNYRAVMMPDRDEQQSTKLETALLNIVGQKIESVLAQKDFYNSASNCPTYLFTCFIVPLHLLMPVQVMICAAAKSCGAQACYATDEIILC